MRDKPVQTDKSETKRKIADSAEVSCKRLLKKIGRPKVDLIDKRFGRLLVLKDIGRDSSNQGVIWKCVCDCGKIFKIKSSNLIRGSTKSCGCLAKERIDKHNKEYWKSVVWTKELSKKWSEAHRGTNKGEKNYNWKGGVSTINMIDRTSSLWKECKANILKRDYYKCVICGVNNKKLQAHHLKSFSKFPELRFVIGNGVTICQNCHEEFHSKYGRKRFTDMDFISFGGAVI